MDCLFFFAGFYIIFLLFLKKKQNRKCIHDAPMAFFHRELPPPAAVMGIGDGRMTTDACSAFRAAYRGEWNDVVEAVSKKLVSVQAREHGGQGLLDYAMDGRLNLRVVEFLTSRGATLTASGINLLLAKLSVCTNADIVSGALGHLLLVVAPTISLPALKDMLLMRGTKEVPTLYTRKMRALLLVSAAPASVLQLPDDSSSTTAAVKDDWSQYCTELRRWSPCRTAWFVCLTRHT